MKRKTFTVAVIAFAATTFTVATATASLRPDPVSVPVWVRRLENIPPISIALNISAGIFNLVLSAFGIELTVRVNDTTTPCTNDTRKGRSSQTSPDPIIKTESATTVTPSPLPTVP